MEKGLAVNKSPTVYNTFLHKHKKVDLFLSDKNELEAWFVLLADKISCSDGKVGPGVSHI